VDRHDLVGPGREIGVLERLGRGGLGRRVPARSGDPVGERARRHLDALERALAIGQDVERDHGHAVALGDALREVRRRVRDHSNAHTDRYRRVGTRGDYSERRNGP
jgi:hypothetical protein